MSRHDENVRAGWHTFRFTHVMAENEDGEERAVANERTTGHNEAASENEMGRMNDAVRDAMLSACRRHRKTVPTIATSPGE